MAKRKRRPKEQFELDIVIPVYGRPDLLQKCLQSIDDTIGDIKARIIVVDDQGPEQEELTEVYQSLNGTSRLIRNPQNSGFPKTVNTGVAAGNAPLILLLNTDIELLPGCLQEMIGTFDDPETGVVGPKLLFLPDSNDPHRPAGKVQHAGLAIRQTGQVVHANIGWSEDHPKVNYTREMSAVTGACFMTRRSVWREVLKLYQQSGDLTTGAMNEVYSPGTYEDVEYCFAARTLDYKVIYQPAARAYHFTNASVLKYNVGYPTGRNEMIFRARCGQMLIWDEWRYL